MHAVGIKSATRHHYKNTAEKVCLGFWENETQVWRPQIFICLLVKKKKKNWTEIGLEVNSGGSLAV